jgi:hypothetical protein
MVFLYCLWTLGSITAIFSFIILIGISIILVRMVEE